MIWIVIAVLGVSILVAILTSIETPTGGSEVNNSASVTDLTPKNKIPDPKYSTEEVGDFYNAHSEAFNKVYGEVFQAFRTIDPSDLLNYEAASMEIKEGMKLLDAGCGIGGPALHFAQNHKVEIEALTISQKQADWAAKMMEEAGLSDRVMVKQGDYHKLSEYYPENTFDIAYFLEAFGHAHDHHKVIDQAWEVLKPGGSIYIKDIFKKIPVLTGHEDAMGKEVQKINEAYKYNIPDLNDIIFHFRKKGWILNFVKTIDLPLEKFENLTISNDFQELTGIGKITNWQEYIFPVDFFEIKAYKPWVNLGSGDSRYFLQNMYFMQVHNWKESEL